MLRLFDPEILEIRPIPILRSETSVSEITLFTIPFGKATVVVPFEIVFYDKRDDATAQALFEKDETPHATISILEGVNALKTDMKIQKVRERFIFLLVIRGEQCLHPRVYVFRRCNRSHGNGSLSQ